MSSADSSVLSASSMFARNIWKMTFRQNASETEILWIMRLGIVFVSFVATIIGITVKSVYGLWFLCSDLVYVVLFPQLFSVVYLDHTNTYGSMVAYWTGILLRLSGGEPLFNLPALIKFPLYDEETNTQRFPFRTMSMLISFSLIITVSSLTNFLFEREILSKKFDIFSCVTSKKDAKAINLKDSTLQDELNKLNDAKYDTNSNTNSSLNDQVQIEMPTNQ